MAEHPNLPLMILFPPSRGTELRQAFDTLPQVPPLLLFSSRCYADFLLNGVERYHQYQFPFSLDMKYLLEHIVC